LSRRGWVLFALMGLIWGIPYLLIKVAVAELPPPTLVFGRTLLGAAILLPLAVSRGDLGGLRGHWAWVLAYTLIEVALPWLLLSDAERRLSSSLSGLMVAAVPLVGAVLAWASGSRHRLDRRGVAGLLIGFAGVGLLVGLDVNIRDIGAAAEIALVAVCYAVGAFIISRRLSGVPASGVIAASLTVTAVAYAPIGLAIAPHRLPSTQVLGAMIGLGVICSALAFIVFFALVREAGPVRATVITYVNPAVALFLGIALLHEPLTLGAGLGFLLILAGSVLANQSGTARWLGRRPWARHHPPCSAS
jgi:drug/metabolite transporter (DMT)-like permease